MPCLITLHSVRAVSLHHAAAHDGVAEKAALPEIDRGRDRLIDAAALAEHEQQVGRPQRRRNQVLGY